MKFCLPKHEAEALVQFKSIELLTINYLVYLFNILPQDTREQEFTIRLCTWWLKSKIHEKPISSANFAKPKLSFTRIYENTIYK